MIRCIIVDDELYSRETLKNLLTDYCTGVEIAGEAGCVESALDLCRKQCPELVFLDIDMPVYNGFDFLDSFETIDFHIVFTTAHNQFAVKAFRYAALDFLLKPINIQELQQAVQRFKDVKSRSNPSISYEALQYYKKKRKFDRIALPSKDGYIFISTESITKIEADSNYSKVYFTDRKPIVICKTLQEFEDILDEEHFLRLHRSHIVNINQIQSFNTKEKYVILNDKTRITVSSRRKALLLNICQSF